MLSGQKVLVTGVTGQVARPVAEALAVDNEVWGLGRFGDRGVEADLAARGIRTWRWDMGRDGLDGLPDDFTHVFHAAMHRGDGTDFDAAVEINCTGTARLMTHCRRATAFLHVSSGGIYDPPDRDRPVAETGPLGGRLPWLPTYPVAKLATEGTVRGLAATLGLPTTIARLNVAYGPYGHGGVPMVFLRRLLAGQPVEVPRDGEDWCNPIHTDDIVRQVPLLWGMASVPARVVNWGGDEVVSLRELTEHLAGVAGVEARFVPSDASRGTVAFDNTRRRAAIGDCRVGWRDGLRRTVEAHFPELVPTARPSREPAVPGRR